MKKPIESLYPWNYDPHTILKKELAEGINHLFEEQNAMKALRDGQSDSGKIWNAIHELEDSIEQTDDSVSDNHDHLCELKNTLEVAIENGIIERVSIRDRMTEIEDGHLRSFIQSAPSVSPSSNSISIFRVGSFEWALQEMKKGKQCRRKSKHLQLYRYRNQLESFEYYLMTDFTKLDLMSTQNILADDWEVCS